MLRRLLDAPIPAELLGIVSRALEADPKARYADAGDMRLALARAVRASP